MLSKHLLSRVKRPLEARLRDRVTRGECFTLGDWVSVVVDLWLAGFLGTIWLFLMTTSCPFSLFALSILRNSKFMNCCFLVKSGELNADVFALVL